MMNRNVADMTQSELEAIIFDGASVYELRGPSNAFTISEICAILDAPHFREFSSSFQTWIFSAWEAHMESHNWELA